METGSKKGTGDIIMMIQRASGNGCLLHYKV